MAKQKMQQTPFFPACMGWFNYTRGGEKRGEKDDRQIVKMYKKRLFSFLFFEGKTRVARKTENFPVPPRISIWKKKRLSVPQKNVFGAKKENK